MIHVDSGSPTFATEEAVLFPFDDYSIPFRKDVLMTLVPGSRQPGEHRENASYEPNHPGKPVLEVGGPGTCDSVELVFPSIARVGDGLRMWYMARGNSETTLREFFRHMGKSAVMYADGHLEMNIVSELTPDRYVPDEAGLSKWKTSKANYTKPTPYDFTTANIGW